MKADMVPMAVTLTGPVAAEDLGMVLPCERVLFNMRDRHRQPESVDEQALRDAPITLGNLAALREKPLCSLVNLCAPEASILSAELHTCASGHLLPPTLVELTPQHGESRSSQLKALRDLSSSVRLIVAAGCSEEEAAAAIGADDDEERSNFVALVDSIVSQLTEGECRAGAIGPLLLDATPPPNALHEVFASAQQRTGAPLICELPHPSDCADDSSARLSSANQMNGSANQRNEIRNEIDESSESDAACEAGTRFARALSVLREQGAALERVLVNHAQHLLPSESAIAQLLSLGVTLCFDGVGNSWSVAGAGRGTPAHLLPPSEEVLARALIRLVRAAPAQIVISPGVASCLQLAAYGGSGYTVDSLLRRMHRLGLAAAEEGLLTRENAARVLCWWLPAGPEPRLMRPWTCTSCHREYMEAVNEAEALPEDHEFFDKFDNRYCSTACLSAHRKAGFLLPFSTQ